MTVHQCPYCGTLLTTSLKFCVNCRRSVTEDKIRRAGDGHIDMDAESGDGAQAKFRLARGTSYDSLRQLRSFCFTTTTLVTIVLVYYCTMKFVIHQPIPFEQEVGLFLQNLPAISGNKPEQIQAGENQPVQTMPQTTSSQEQPQQSQGQSQSQTRPY